MKTKKQSAHTSNKPLSANEHSTSSDYLSSRLAELELIVDMLPHMVFAKDENGRYTLANQEVAKSFNKPKDQIIGFTDIEINPGSEDSKRFMEQDREMLQTGKSIFIPEEPLLHKSTNDLRWYHTTKHTLISNDEQIKRIVGVAVDMTERRKAEQALKLILAGIASKTAEDFLKSLVYHLAKALNTEFAFISRVAKNHKTAETLAAWCISDFLPNSSYILEGSPSAEVLKGELIFYPSNLCQYFPEDLHLAENHIQAYMGAPIFDMQGNAIGLLSVMDSHPMSDWEYAKHIMKIFAEMAGAELHRIEKEQESLKLQSQLQQSQKMEALGQLAAGVAHDLNNALSAVAGHLEIARENASESQNESLTQALDGCQKATDLISQLLSFSKQNNFTPKQINLHDLVSNTIKFLSRIIPQNIRVVHETIDQPTFIYGEKNQLQQVITNLIINAYQAMPSGGSIHITYNFININNPKLFNINSNPGEFISLVISDSGHGIPNEIKQKIFEPFFTTKSHLTGTGLGLAMAYRTMQNHQGWIEVSSTEGIGTDMILFLPLQKSSSIEKNIGNEEIKLDFTPNIMVIEDEYFLVELAVKFLEKYSMKGIGFTEPQVALGWYRENFSKIDLVIIDMKMPKLDGLQTFKNLKKINPNIQAIILSGYNNDSNIQSVIDHGAIKYFQKPLKYPDLMNWIKNYLKTKIAA
jgi:PAS domain S-box-containing protein